MKPRGMNEQIITGSTKGGEQTIKGTYQYNVCINGQSDLCSRLGKYRLPRKKKLKLIGRRK